MIQISLFRRLFRFEEELEDKSYELLFTTVPVHANQGFTILLPPMISAMNLKEIYSQIQTVLDRKKMQILTEYYPQFSRLPYFILTNKRTAGAKTF